MRQAINENRALQLALVGVLAVVAGFMLLKPKGGGSESSAQTPATPAPSAAAPDPNASATATPAPSTGATASTPAPAATDAAAPTVPASMVPGPGLPKGLLRSYRHGDAIALLIRRAGGIDDALVRGSVDSLRTEPRVKVYVTRARHIARYAWLAQGVDVTDLPALVVLRPRGLTNGRPTASVSYGFRGPHSVVQAVDDALYRGPADRPYHP
jgi:hypothetical protein